MPISEILKKMILFSNGSIHDISHLTAVWAYARTIGEMEGLDAHTQFILEAAAIVHDIACPFIRDMNGRTDHKRQETEGAPLAERFLAECGVSTADTARICWLVGHHHTLQSIDGIDYQILIEADYIVNAMEKQYPPEQVESFATNFAKTKAGTELMRSIFKL